MQTPKDPSALIGAIVRSLRDPDRIGVIEALGIDCDRPRVRWSGNAIPIFAEWRHIDLTEEAGADAR